MGLSRWDLLKFRSHSIRHKILFQRLLIRRRIKILIQAIKRVQEDRPQEQGQAAHKTEIPELGSENKHKQTTNTQPISLDKGKSNRLQLWRRLIPIKITRQDEKDLQPTWTKEREHLWWQVQLITNWVHEIILRKTQITQHRLERHQLA